MSRRNYIYKNIRSVSPYFKKAALAQALEQGTTMSDVIGEILAEHYGDRYERSGEETMGATIPRDGYLGGDQFRIQIPPRIGLRITQEARRTKQTESSVVLGVLAAHFGLIHEPVRKGRKRAAA